MWVWCAAGTAMGCLFEVLKPRYCCCLVACTPFTFVVLIRCCLIAMLFCTCAFGDNTLAVEEFLKGAIEINDGYTHETVLTAAN